MGRTNDVHTKNSNSGVTYISQFVNKNTGTNIIMITIPHCCNHSDTSSINSEVKKFNRKLHTCMMLNTNVTVIDGDQSKECFTKQGLHWNGLGKEVICKQIATIIDKLFQTDKVLPICVDWETNPTIRIACQDTNTCNDLKNTNRNNNISVFV